MAWNGVWRVAFRVVNEGVTWTLCVSCFCFLSSLGLFWMFCLRSVQRDGMDRWVGLHGGHRRNTGSDDFA
jgi:hypothetical protein